MSYTEGPASDEQELKSHQVESSTICNDDITDDSPETEFCRKMKIVTFIDETSTKYRGDINKLSN